MHENEYNKNCKGGFMEKIDFKDIPNSIVVAGVFLLNDYLAENGLFRFNEFNDESYFTNDGSNQIYNGTSEEQPYQCILKFFDEKKRNFQTLKGFFPEITQYDESYLEKAKHINAEPKHSLVLKLKNMKMYETISMKLIEIINTLCQKFAENQTRFLPVHSNFSHHNIEITDDFCRVYRLTAKNAKFLYNKNIAKHEESIVPARKRISIQYNKYIDTVINNSVKKDAESNM